MSEPPLPKDRDHAWTARDARRERIERHADDYDHPSDWRPEPDTRSVGAGLLSVLVAGAVVLMLVLAVFFVWPDREDVRAPGVRVSLPEGPRLPDAPDLPEPPALPPR